MKRILEHGHMTFLFLMLCIFGGIATLSARHRADRSNQYDWDRAL